MRLIDLLTVKNQISSLSSIDFKLFDDNGDSIVIPTTTNEQNGIFTVTLDIYSGVFDLSYYD